MIYNRYLKIGCLYASLCAYFESHKLLGMSTTYLIVDTSKN